MLNNYKWCYLGDTGGVFYLENTFLTDTGTSKFEYNAAITGGAIMCNRCSLNMV